MAAEDVVAGAGGGAVERAVGHPHGGQPALHVGDENRRAPRDVQVLLELIGHAEVAVVDRQLEVSGHAAGAALEIHLAVVVHCRAPLRVVAAGGLLPDRPAVHGGAGAEGVDGAVEPVVHGPEQARLLVLDVGEPAKAAGEQLLLVRGAVVVGVGELPHLVRIRLHRQDRVGPIGHDEARKHELVDEDLVRLVLAVVVPILVHRDAADRIELAARVRILHVAAQLEDEHPAVAVEGDLRGLLDVRIGEYRLELEAGRQPDLPGLFLRRQHRCRWLGTVVGGRVGGIVLLRTAQPAAAAAAGRLSRLAGRLGAWAAPCGPGAGVGAWGNTDTVATRTAPVMTSGAPTR